GAPEQTTRQQAAPVRIGAEPELGRMRSGVMAAQFGVLLVEIKRVPLSIGQAVAQSEWQRENAGERDEKDDAASHNDSLAAEQAPRARVGRCFIEHRRKRRIVRWGEGWKT